VKKKEKLNMIDVVIKMDKFNNYNQMPKYIERYKKKMNETLLKNKNPNIERLNMKKFRNQ